MKQPTTNALPQSIDATLELLAKANYLADRSLATVLFLALRMGRPIFLEGEAGVGKTEIGKVLAGLQQMGLTYRGLYGEGSEVLGNFFQISNQTTLGRSEEELADHLLRVVRHVIQREQEARRVLWRDAGYIIEDKLWRAYGTLRYARSLGFDEAMNLLSGVRLAVGLQLVKGVSVYTLNKLLVFCQSAHLSYLEGRALTEVEADIARARHVREALASEAGPLA